MSNSKIRDSEGFLKSRLSDASVVKQETYTNDTLRSYIVFEYDSNNRLKKQININTNNGFGIILDKSFTGNTTKKYLNENDTITYKNVEIGDTLVTSKYTTNPQVTIKRRKIAYSNKFHSFSRVICNHI